MYFEWLLFPLFDALVSRSSWRSGAWTCTAGQAYVAQLARGPLASVFSWHSSLPWIYKTAPLFYPFTQQWTCCLNIFLVCVSRLSLGTWGAALLWWGPLFPAFLWGRLRISRGVVWGQWYVSYCGAASWWVVELTLHGRSRSAFIGCCVLDGLSLHINDS